MNQSSTSLASIRREAISEYSDFESQDQSLVLSKNCIEKYLYEKTGQISSRLKQISESIFSAEAREIDAVLNTLSDLVDQIPYAHTRIRLAKIFNTPHLLTEEKSSNEFIKHYLLNKIKINWNKGAKTQENKEKIAINFMHAQLVESLLIPEIFSNVDLTALKCAFSHISDQELFIDRISKAKFMQSLQKLELLYLNLGDEALMEILNSQNLDKVSCLNLKGNCISNAGLVKAADSSQISKLMDVNLCDNDFTVDAALRFAEKADISRNAEFVMRIKGLSTLEKEKRESKNKIMQVFADKGAYVDL